MGASLAKVVLSATWAHLPPAARLLFAHMAVTALDPPSRPRFWAGRDVLVLALDGELCAPGPLRGQQYRRVRRHLEQLRTAGAIVQVAGAHHGQNAEYELVVMPAGKEVTQRPPSLPAKEVIQRPPQEVSQRPPLVPKGGHSTTGKEVTQRPPEEQAGATREQDLPQEASGRVGDQGYEGARGRWAAAG